MESVKCKAWTVKCRVWRKECSVWNVKCGMKNAQCGVWSLPAVPHKAAAGSLRIGNLWTVGELGCCESRMAERIH